LVILSKERQGLIRYAGKVEFDGYDGYWYGVELLGGAIGYHDGSFGGKRYFTTRADGGIFILPDKIVRKMILTDLLYLGNDNVNNNINNYNDNFFNFNNNSSNSNYLNNNNNSSNINISNNKDNNDTNNNNINDNNKNNNNNNIDSTVNLSPRKKNKDKDNEKPKIKKRS